MQLLTPPGVFRPRSDSRLLAETVRKSDLRGCCVLDLCTGCGIVAISAALAGAAEVVAVDITRVAVVTAGLNARLNGISLKTRRGDLFEPVAGERFDLITANPPYLPGTELEDLAPRDPARAWEGGPDGRIFVDRIIDGAAAHLRPGGALLLLHSSVCGIDTTLERLAAAGLDGEVTLRHSGPLGPLLTARAEHLEASGLLAPGQRDEDIVIIRAARGS